MRILFIAQGVLLFVGIGYAFRISDFLEVFSDEKSNNERQSEVDDQIVPVFLIAFFASLVNSLLFMNTGAAEESYSGWCYEGECAAEFWPTLYPEYCAGTRQSPIDIPYTEGSTTLMTESTPLSMTGYNNVRANVVLNTEEQITDYVTISGVENDIRFGNPYGFGMRPRQSRQSSSLNNNGHTAQVNVYAPDSATDGILSGGPLSEDYKILQFHFHWGKDSSRGSEHTINGKEYPIELHIVHYKGSLSNLTEILNTPDGLAVTGFMFEVDTADNIALRPLTDALKNVIASDSSVAFETSGFRVDQLIRDVTPIGGNYKYSHYEGSLTTPTCNEAVMWINFLDPLKISEAQLDLFRAMMDSHGHNIVDNYRPPQPLNGRVPVFFGSP